MIERDELLDLLAVTASADGGFVLTSEDGGVQNQLYLVKLRSGGSVEWDRPIGVSGRVETGRAVAAVRDGGYVVAGSASGSVYLGRTDSGGEPLFDRVLGAGIGSAVCEDPGSGAIVVLGERGVDAVVLKTDAFGQPLWERTIAPEDPYGAARFGGVVVTPEGDCFAVGSFRSGPGLAFVERAAILLAAIGPDGTTLERRILAPGGWIREAHSLVPTPDGVLSSLTRDPGEGSGARASLLPVPRQLSGGRAARRPRARRRRRH